MLMPLHSSVLLLRRRLQLLACLAARPNVLVLATSNITESIDVAFIDRADLKLHLPPPTPTVQARIVAASVMELLRAGVVVSGGGAPAVAGATRVDDDDDGGPSQDNNGAVSQESHKAVAAAVHAEVLRILLAAGCADAPISGRTLRKLPMLAFVHGDVDFMSGPLPLQEYMPALEQALATDLDNRRAIASA